MDREALLPVVAVPRLAARLQAPAVLVLAGAVAAGALLRLVGLTRQGFWTDELYVVWGAVSARRAQEQRRRTAETQRRRDFRGIARESRLASE